MITETGTKKGMRGTAEKRSLNDEKSQIVDLLL